MAATDALSVRSWGLCCQSPQSVLPIPKAAVPVYAGLHLVHDAAVLEAPSCGTQSSIITIIGVAAARPHISSSEHAATTMPHTHMHTANRPLTHAGSPMFQAGDTQLQYSTCLADIPSLRCHRGHRSDLRHVLSHRECAIMLKPLGYWCTEQSIGSNNRLMPESTLHAP